MYFSGKGLKLRKISVTMGPEETKTAHATTLEVNNMFLSSYELLTWENGPEPARHVDASVRPRKRWIAGRAYRKVTRL